MRKPRVHVRGGIYHLMLRGNNGQEIFFENKDKWILMSFIDKTLQKCDAIVHAYCLMPNHIHLVIQVNDISISQVIQYLACRYVKYINIKYKRYGNLFQGRFKSIFVDGNKYFLTLIRYIHQNPLRANLISSLEEFWWSSHFDYTGRGKTTWVTQDLTRSLFLEKNKNWLEEYNEFMKITQTKEEFYDFFYKRKIKNAKKPMIIEEIECTRKTQPKLTLEQILEFCEKEFGISKELLTRKSKKPEITYSRSMVVSLAYLTKTATLKELAVYFNQHVNALSRCFNRFLLSHKEKISELIKRCQA